jgi:aryl-alcohol dehydrogenase-like predicted oxidoreductase
MWDGITPIEEVMRAFDDLVGAGKVQAVGISDTPAWVISRGIALAELRGWTVPCAIQLPYSVSGRDAERELMPMASALGLAVTVWGVLNGGVLTGKYGRSDGDPRRYGDETPSERSVRAAAAVKEVADACDATPAQVCLAWALARRPEVNLIPILGARNARQLEENLGALDVQLGADMQSRLDESSGFLPGFPRSFLADEEVVGLIFGETREMIEA